MNIHHNLPHWNYFRLLERDLEECFAYVHPCEQHFNVYSDHFARIILMASSEIENCLNSFAAAARCEPKPSYILKHHECVTGTYARFCEAKLVMPRYSIELFPWEGWSQTAAPDWWTLGYNKIKHDRNGHPDAPTMLRAINSVGALLALLLHYYRLVHGADCGMPSEIAPKLMIPWERNNDFLGITMSWHWELPDEIGA